MTETLQELSIAYHLDSSTGQESSSSMVGTQNARMIPIIRVRESATGGSEFVDDKIPLDVFHALGDLSSKISVDTLQFRYSSSLHLLT